MACKAISTLINGVVTTLGHERERERERESERERERDDK
jgi:hypothetical protein